MSGHTPIISFVAPSGTGKTTLIEAVIPQLADRGYRVGVLKHDAHGLELDKPGKDTWRFRHAGAYRVVIASSSQLAVFSSIDGEVTIGGMAESYLREADLLITEGFRRADIDSIRVHRQGRGEDPDWVGPQAPVAWVSDVETDRGVPTLNLNAPEQVTEFIINRYFKEVVRATRSTLLLPITAGVKPDAVIRAVQSFSHLFDGRVLIVSSGANCDRILDIPTVQDLRPELGPLGALLTGLATVNTEDVFLLGERHYHVDPKQIEALMAAANPKAEIVTPRRDGYSEPLFTIYGHRCLSAIQGSLLSGEAKMNGWWGLVRVQRV